MAQKEELTREGEGSPFKLMTSLILSTVLGRTLSGAGTRLEMTRSRVEDLYASGEQAGCKS